MASSDWPPRESGPAFSYTNRSTFNECLRRWMLQYQTQLLPPDLRREAYLEKQLLAFNMVVGQVVHDTIDEALRDFLKGKPWPEDLRQAAERQLKATVRYSRRWTEIARSPGGRTERSDFFRPVDLFYFDDPLPEEEKLRIRGEIASAIGRFSAHPLLQEMLAASSKWRLPIKPGPAPWFWSGDVPVYANYDFALVGPEGATVIDWKTGRSERAEAKVREQLIAYAVYATLEWNMPLEKVRSLAVWLGDDTTPSEFLYTEEEVAEAKAHWEDQRAQMRVRVALAEADPQNALDAFPMTTNLWTCRRCTFRSCEGRQRGTSGSVQEALAGYNSSPIDEEDDRE